MATKTVVCLECGSATTPGRYTCGDCGAFLDGVAVVPRTWDAATDPSTDAPSPSLAADPAPETASAVDEDAILAADDPLVADGPALDPVDPALPPPPDVLRDVEWPAAAASADRLVGTAAPPPLPPPEPRVPAGSWLPPSALLTGLEGPAAGGAATAVGGPAAAVAATNRQPRDWSALLGTPGRRWAAARRTIAIATMAIIVGFMLPWANGSASALLQVWTSVWGLAGAGHWLAVLLAAGLGLLAASTGRAASVPLGVPAVATATFVLGLIWPTLLGASTRPIGILVTFVGVVALFAGGVLHLGARHEAATPDV